MFVLTKEATSSEKLNDLSKFTQLVSGGPKMQGQGSLMLEPTRVPVHSDGRGEGAFAGNTYQALLRSQRLALPL